MRRSGFDDLPVLPQGLALVVNALFHPQYSGLPFFHRCLGYAGDNRVSDIDEQVVFDRRAIYAPSPFSVVGFGRPCVETGVSHIKRASPFDYWCGHFRSPEEKESAARPSSVMR